MNKKNPTMGKRILGIAIIVPIGVGLVLAGGWFFTGGVAAILAIAAWEYWNLFQGSSLAPNRCYLVISAVLSAVSRYIFGGVYFELVFTAIFISGVIISLYRYENEETYNITTFGMEMAGILFIAYFGSYLVSLRFLPDGKMWVLLAIPAIGSGDIGAFLLGSKWGKHKMAPRVSPQKSMEGYAGGILFTVLYAFLFTLIFTYGTANITIQRAILLGLILGIISPIGDLLESLFKRTFNRKDSGKLIPGHGGILDRIDTWLVGGAVAYLIISHFWIP